MLVSICMCTYKRASLEKTLTSIVQQKMPQGYEIEIVVVDNDVEESGRAICEKVQQLQSTVAINYFVNGIRNLSNIRNSTMEHAAGDLFLFIDDDEWASTDTWLAQLIKTLNEHNADIVFGRVLVHYPDSTPDWIEKGDMLGKPVFPHGRLLKKGATSNALMRAHWAREKGFVFDPYFGKSGGEDTDLFHRIYKAGGKLVYDAYALVEEIAEPQRVNLAYIKKLNTRIGHTHYAYLWSKQSGLAYITTGLFVLAQIAGYGLLAVVSLPFGKGRYMRWYVKFIRNVVKLKTAIARGGKPVELYGNH